MRLRSHLLLLVLAVLMPVVAFGVFIVYRDIGEQRQIRDQGMRDTARALSLAMDGEVKAALAVLQTLSGSALLDARDFKGFHALSRAAVEGRQGAWIVLFDSSGQQIANTSRPFGSPLPNPLLGTRPVAADAGYLGMPLGGAAPVRAVLETGRPIVSDLFVALDSRKPTIGVGVPVARGGAVRYVLEMSVEPESLLQLLRSHRLPQHSVIALVDGQGLVIARTGDSAGRLGRPLGAELARQVASVPEGTGLGRTVEGTPVFHAFTRSNVTGWTVSLGVSEAVAVAPIRESVLLLIGAAGFALLLGAALALAIGRRVSTPLTRLAACAEAMARGEASDSGASEVSELAHLRRALVTAGTAVRRAAEERERSVVNHVLDGIITIDEGGSIESFNPAAEKIFGFQASEVIGKNVRILMPDRYRQHHDAGLASYLKTGQAKVIGAGREVEGRRKDGSIFPIDIAVSEFRVGAKRFFTGIVRDITARKQAEQALLDANTAKDEFLAMLSHELRNPLAALTAASHVLNAVEPTRPEARSARGVIERQTRQMAALISDLLDLSRVAIGKLALQREPVNVADAISYLEGAWRTSGRFDRHKVVVSMQPAWIKGDRARIEQIAANLLDNALKFTPAGKSVTMRVGQEGGEVVLQVADEGAGLAAEERERVFDLYMQGERAGGGGLGIGLALVKRLTELQGGSVSVASEGPDRGAVFTVRFPAAEQPAHVLEALPTRKSEACSILIVEDNDDARQMLHATLTLDGHEVRAARDGKTGLAMAAAVAPDVALIDINLPDMEGYEVARRLRALNGSRRIGLVAVTGLGQEEDQRRAYQAGFDAHLVKPVATERLQQVILELG
jgi:two-component system, sensor histidine kinase